MNKKYVLIGGVVVLAVLVYLWYTNKTPYVPAPGASLPSSPGTTTPGIITPGAGTAVASTLVNPVTQQVSTAWLAANGTVEIPGAVQSWIESTGPANQANFMKQMSTMTGAEISSLNDIAINAWGKGAQPTQNQVTFWNTWCSKYGFPVGGSFSNFTGRPKINAYGKKVR